MVKGFKAMNLDMTCRGYQFEVGKTYEIDNDKPLELCTDSGFHFCLSLNDVFDYYSYDNCRLFEIETFGEVITKYDKSATKKLHIVRELTQDELDNYSFNKLKPDLWFKDRTDEELLVYKDHHDYEIRVIVAKKLKDLNLMFNIFKDDDVFEVRETVVERMEDLNLIFNTFKNDHDLYIRAAVVKRLEDLNLIFNTFKNDPYFYVRKAVVERMEDLNLMYETFKSDITWQVRMSVVERMEDLDLMYRTFKDDPDYIVRQRVKQRLNKLD